MKFDEVQIYFLLERGMEKERGPYSLVQLREMWADGIINGEMLYAAQGMQGWEPLSEFEKLANPPREDEEIKKEAATAQKKPPVLQPPMLSLKRLPLPVIGICGICMIVAGSAGMFFFALLFDTSVATETGRVVNLGLANDRYVGMMGSTALAITGGLFVIGEAIRRTLLIRTVT